MADISNFVVDAAIDAWFGHPVWRTVTRSPEWIEDHRARMRRVLDAHDVARRVPVDRVERVPFKITSEDDAEDDPNALPMEALPEGWAVDCIYFIDPDWGCILNDADNEWRADTGPTPRAAMLAAIEAAKEGK